MSETKNTYVYDFVRTIKNIDEMSKEKPLEINPLMIIIKREIKKITPNRKNIKNIQKILEESSKNNINKNYNDIIQFCRDKILYFKPNEYMYLLHNINLLLLEIFSYLIQRDPYLSNSVFVLNPIILDYESVHENRNEYIKWFQYRLNYMLYLILFIVMSIEIYTRIEKSCMKNIMILIIKIVIFLKKIISINSPQLGKNNENLLDIIWFKLIYGTNIICDCL
jgi:hypothetical protein